MATRKNSSIAAPGAKTPAQDNKSNTGTSSVPTASQPLRTVPLTQLHALLTEAAVLADTTDEQCYHFPADSDPEQLLLHGMALRDVICRLGWMADLALKVIGEGVIRGDAEKWLIGFIARGEDNQQFLVLANSATSEAGAA